MSGAPYRVACYFARPHGLVGLRAILDSDRFAPACVLTHRRRPAFEDPERGPRPEFAEYERLTHDRSVPLFAIDSRRQRDAALPRLEPLQPDLIASISWRLLITPEELALARLGGVNLHRGKLPDYPGGFPLHRALENRDSTVGLTAHLLAQEIDAGEIIEIVEHSVEHDEGCDIDDHVEKLKQEISPLFGPLLLRALTACVERNE